MNIEAATLQQKVNELVENIKKALAYKSTNPVSLLRMQKKCCFKRNLDYNNPSVEGGFVVIELKVLEKVLGHKENAYSSDQYWCDRERVRSCGNWISQAKQCSLKQQRKKSKPAHQATKRNY